jgi:hypothetical protein
LSNTDGNNGVPVANAHMANYYLKSTVQIPIAFFIANQMIKKLNQHPPVG